VVCALPFSFGKESKHEAQATQLNFGRCTVEALTLCRHTLQRPARGSHRYINGGRVVLCKFMLGLPLSSTMGLSLVTGLFVSFLRWCSLVLATLGKFAWKVGEQLNHPAKPVIETQSDSGCLSHRTISRPLSAIKAEYDVVVVGSGYGGGVAASRISRASPKQSVCVLERGQERWPGQFPSTILDALKNIRMRGAFHLGSGRGWNLNFGGSRAMYVWMHGRARSFFFAYGALHSRCQSTELNVVRSWWNKPHQRQCVLATGLEALPIGSVAS
jgi:hypothetical protein